MKSILLSFGFVLLSVFTFGQDAHYEEVECQTKQIEFFDRPEFEFNVKKIITIEKREGVKVIGDLSPSELKKIEKQAKKQKCCKVVYVLHGDTPHGLSLPDQETEENVFRFYIVKEVQKKTY